MTRTPDLATAQDGHPWAPGRLPERDLEPAELAGLARTVADRPDLWREHVRHDGVERHYASLHRDDHVDVWLICWTPVSDTGWHDHDSSAGAVAVASGGVVEHRLRLDGPPAEHAATEGETFTFGPDHIHRMRGRDATSVTVHAYSPPLWRMGQYDVEGGVLRRRSLSYAEELRPLPGRLSGA